MADGITYKILEAYREKELDPARGIVSVIGLVALVASVILDSTPLAIGGGTVLGAETIESATNYAKAYMEARLDYLQNKKFTRLPE